MTVLLDLEWIEREHEYPTQLSAIRTDETWNTVDTLELFIRPPLACMSDAEHMAFGGYPLDTFRKGLSEEACVYKLRDWLLPDDVIWVWSKKARFLLKNLWDYYLPRDPFPSVCPTSDRIRAHTKLDGSDEPRLYDMLERLEIAYPLPDHRASNDVEAMRRLLDHLKMTVSKMKWLRPASEPQPIPKGPTQRELNQKAINNSEYNYIYLKDSGVFHRRDCKLCLSTRSVGNILGSVYWETAAETRRPCRICQPHPHLYLARANNEKLRKREAQDPNFLKRYNKEIVHAKMLGGETIEIKRGNIVGWCHCHLHPGAMNKSILEAHNCLEKGCFHLARNDQSPYWAALQAKEHAEKVRQSKILHEKVRRYVEAAELQELTDKWRSYLKDLDSDMHIVRLEKAVPSVYKVFYVSDNPFADGNRFPLFLETIKYFHPNYRVILRHIRDVDGHFVTTDEYFARAKERKWA